MTTKTVTTITDATGLTNWFTASQAKNLTTLDEIDVGYIDTTSDINVGSTLTFSNANVDAGRFRALIWNPAKAYDPISGNGGKLVDTSGANVLDFAEEFVYVANVWVDKAGFSNSGFVTNSSDPGNCHFYRCGTLGSNNDQNGFFNYGDEASYHHTCAAIGTGTNYGFIFAGAPANKESWCFNCLAFDCTGLTGQGFREANCVGCIAIDNTTDFSHLSNGSDIYSISSDATAVGTGSQASQTAANCFVDSASDDLRVKDSDSPQVNAGIWIPPVKPLHPEVALTTPGSMPSLATGLDWFFPISEGQGNTSTDIVTGVDTVTKHANHTWKRTVALTALNSPSGSVGVRSGTPLYSKTGAWTLELICRPDWPGAGVSYLIREFGASSRYAFGVNTSGEIHALIQDDAGSGVINTAGSGAVVSEDVPTLLTIVDDSDGLRIYANGSLLHDFGSYVRPDLTVATQNFPHNATGDYYSVGRWSRALTADEIRHRVQHPWSLIGGEEPKDLRNVYRPQPTQAVSYDVGPYEFVPPRVNVLQPKPVTPVLNRAHPLAQGLTLAVPGSLWDIANGKRGTPTNIRYEPLGLDLTAGTTPKVVFSESSAGAGPLCTVAAWVKFDSFASLKAICASTTSGIAVYVSRVSPGNITFSARTVNDYDFATIIELDKWFHVVTALELDSNRVRLFINGVELEALTHGTPPTFATGDLTVGNDSGGARSCDHMADLKVWNRTLTAREIADLYVDELNGSWSLYRG